MVKGDKYSELYSDPLMEEFAPYFKDGFLGQKVRVRSSERSYVGWCRMASVDRTSVLLYDAEREDGQRFSDVFVDDVRSIECLSGERSIRSINVNRLRPSPYSVREYSDENVLGYARWYRFWTHPITFPIVRPISDETYDYEVVSGHRRLKAAKHAGFGEIPVQIAEMDDWEATRRFADEHIPLPHERDADDHGYYSDEDVEKALALLLEDWSPEELREIVSLEPYVEEYQNG